MEKTIEHEMQTGVMKVKGCTMPKCTDLGGAGGGLQVCVFLSTEPSTPCRVCGCLLAGSQS